MVGGKEDDVLLPRRRDRRVGVRRTDDGGTVKYVKIEGAAGGAGEAEGEEGLVLTLDGPAVASTDDSGTGVEDRGPASAVTVAIDAASGDAVTDGAD